MRDAGKTIGNMIDKASVSIISSVDEDGFPNSKVMLPPLKMEGITVISNLRILKLSREPRAYNQ